MSGRTQFGPSRLAYSPSQRLKKRVEQNTLNLYAFFYLFALSMNLSLFFLFHPYIKLFFLPSPFHPNSSSNSLLILFKFLDHITKILPWLSTI